MFRTVSSIWGFSATGPSSWDEEEGLNAGLCEYTVTHGAGGTLPTFNPAFAAEAAPLVQPLGERSAKASWNEAKIRAAVEVLQLCIFRWSGMLYYNLSEEHEAKTELEEALATWSKAMEAACAPAEYTKAQVDAVRGLMAKYPTMQEARLPILMWARNVLDADFLQGNPLEKVFNGGSALAEELELIQQMFPHLA